MASKLMLRRFSLKFLPKQPTRSAYYTTTAAMRPVQVGSLMPSRKYDPGRWIVRLWGDGTAFKSQEELWDHYLETLSHAVGSVEEARKKIYLASAEWSDLCFGAKIDKATIHKLEDLPHVSSVIEDFYEQARQMSSIAKSTIKCIPLSQNQRFFNIFNYQQLSQCARVEDPGHWLINIDEHGMNCADPDQVISRCVELLSKSVGSVKEAQKKIYIIWCVKPFGFGAEMDEATSKMLKDVDGVLHVLPDWSHDVKNKDDEALLVFPPPGYGPDPILEYGPLKYEDSSNTKEFDPYGPEPYLSASTLEGLDGIWRKLIPEGLQQ